MGFSNSHRNSEPEHERTDRNMLDPSSRRCVARKYRRRFCRLAAQAQNAVNIRTDEQEIP